MLGHANGGHLNMVAALGAYAALRRARGETVLPRPTAAAGFGMSFADQFCDANLLSAAMGWAVENFTGGIGGVSPQCQVYNIDNGDVASWDVSIGAVSQRAAG